ncbi:MAG: hypothetical protein RRA32_00390 [bacterium]|nr:hypothetical protein [bacterium]
MPVFNYAKKEVNVKVVYYGPGLSGKTTNLQQIHEGIKPEFKGKLVSLATQTDRTLFFDFMPLELGSLGGYKVRLHIYTVPGQVHYNATRKLVLKGVDGVVFIADSQRAMSDANVESFLNLEKNLQSYGKALVDLPHLIQANKRDLDDIASMDEIGALLNRYGAPLTEAVASEGKGALETLTEIVRMVMRGLRDQFRRQINEREDEASVTDAVSAPEPPPAPAPVAEPMVVSDTVSDPVPEPPRPDPSRGEPETAVTDRAQPIRVNIPVKGIGTLELSIMVTAKIVEEDRSLEVQVESAAIEGAEPEIDTDTDTDTVLEPVFTSGEAVVDKPEPEPETETVTETETPPPLGEESAEPLGAPLDGQEMDPEVEPLDVPEAPLPEVFLDDEKILTDDDAAPADTIATDSTEHPLDRYDPTAKPIDLFAESGDEPAPQEPAPKKKGFFGRFKK